jgi:hypothetical protein
MVILLTFSASCCSGATGARHKNSGVTEIASIANRGHSLTTDSGWREVRDTALAFVRRFAWQRHGECAAAAAPGVHMEHLVR